MKYFPFILTFAFLLGGTLCLAAPAEDDRPEDLDAYCRQHYEKDGGCPETVCRLTELPGQEGEEPSQECRAQECVEIEPKDCPQDYCALMQDCSGEKICHYQMPGDLAECGDLAYAGQDVPCCPGLVQRCGIEFLDGTCDMEGKDSVYNLPICIPCGDGICGNFENRCNCPEDCGIAPSHGGTQRDLPFAYIKVPGEDQAEEKEEQTEE